MDKENSVEVTVIGIVETTTPTPMNLAEYEGKVIMISAVYGRENMVYRAKIEDVANPILSAIVLKICNKS